MDNIFEYVFHRINRCEEIDFGSKDRKYYFYCGKCHYHVYMGQIFIQSDFSQDLEIKYNLTEEDSLLIIKHISNKILKIEIEYAIHGSKMIFDHINSWYVKKI